MGMNVYDHEKCKDTKWYVEPCVKDARCMAFPS